MNILRKNLHENIKINTPGKSWEEMTDAEFTKLYPYLDPEDRFL